MVSEGYGGMLWPLCRGANMGYEGMPFSHFGGPFIPYPPFDRNPEVQPRARFGDLYSSLVALPGARVAVCKLHLCHQMLVR